MELGGGGEKWGLVGRQECYAKLPRIKEESNFQSN